MGSVQVDESHYAGMEYDSKKRFISYWHQIAAVIQRRPASVLEIGTGSGFVSDYLRAHGVRVTTYDFDAALSPDVVGAAQSLPFVSGSFDLVLCCQVLEHMPPEVSAAALREFRRVSRRHVVLSLPDVTPVARLVLPVPGRWITERLVPAWWKPAPKRVKNPREHYWEIGIRGFPLRKFLEMVDGAGLDVLERYRVPENPYHHFFELGVRAPAPAQPG